MNQEAIDDFSRADFGRTANLGGTMGVGASRTNLAEMTNAYNKNESMQIIQNLIIGGQMDRLKEEVTRKSAAGKIRSLDLKSALTDGGQLPKSEADRLVKTIEVNDQVDISDFYSLVHTARNQAEHNSLALHKFNEALRNKA